MLGGSKIQPHLQEKSVGDYDQLLLAEEQFITT
jgi:hypothetical protein